MRGNNNEMIRNRKIGPVLATLLVANNMIGSGIFLLPATLATVGSITIIGWVLATVSALVIAAVLAKLGQVAPEAGGPVAYAGTALGPYIGFQATVLYWICAWVGNMAIALAAVGYLATFFPALATPLNAAFAAVGIIWLVTLINVFGPRFACQVESVTLVAGLIPILLVATAGWYWFDPARSGSPGTSAGSPRTRRFPAHSCSSTGPSSGWKARRSARRSWRIPRGTCRCATIAGVLLAGVVYIASCTVIMGLIPAAAAREVHRAVRRCCAVRRRLRGRKPRCADGVPQGERHAVRLGAADGAGGQGRRGARQLPEDLRSHGSPRHSRHQPDHHGADHDGRRVRDHVTHARAAVQQADRSVGGAVPDHLCLLVRCALAPRHIPRRSRSSRRSRA